MHPMRCLQATPVQPDLTSGLEPVHTEELHTCSFQRHCAPLHVLGSSQRAPCCTLRAYTCPQEAALRKALLEAAYDGDDSTLREGLGRAAAQGLLRPDPVDAADPHGNTLLSEAAAGGAAGTAAMLLQVRWVWQGEAGKD